MKDERFAGLTPAQVRIIERYLGEHIPEGEGTMEVDAIDRQSDGKFQIFYCYENRAGLLRTGRFYDCSWSNAHIENLRFEDEYPNRKETAEGELTQHWKDWLARSGQLPVLT